MASAEAPVVSGGRRPVYVECRPWRSRHFGAGRCESYDGLSLVSLHAPDRWACGAVDVLAHMGSLGGATLGCIRIVPAISYRGASFVCVASCSRLACVGQADCIGTIA